MATRKYTDHPEVVLHSCRGMVVRFRKVEDAVYIPVTDARNLLQLGSSTIPIFEICYTCAKIEFYKNSRALSAIQPCDLENLAKRGVKAPILPDQKEKIAWMRNVCNQILAEDHTPEAALQIFSNSEFGEVRTMIEDGEPLFCLTDVCKAVEISNPRNVKSRLDQEDVRLMDTLTKGGVQQLTYITESGLYDAILRSDSSKAKPFRKWVVKEVLPSIRRTGGYLLATENDTKESLLAKNIATLNDAMLRLEKRLTSTEATLALAAPKVDYYRVVIEDRETYTLAQIASELGTTYHTLRRRLFNAGVLVSLVGEIVIDPKYNDWGQLIRVPSGRYRTSFRWNKHGRDSIFNLIDPSMPK